MAKNKINVVLHGQPTNQQLTAINELQQTGKLYYHSMLLESIDTESSCVQLRTKTDQLTDQLQNFEKLHPVADLPDEIDFNSVMAWMTTTTSKVSTTEFLQKFRTIKMRVSWPLPSVTSTEGQEDEGIDRALNNLIQFIKAAGFLKHLVIINAPAEQMEHLIKTVKSKLVVSFLDLF